MGIHTNTHDWTGNLVFYTSYGDSVGARFTAWAVRTFTHGPYCHVGVVLNEACQVIQATNQGVVIDDLPKQNLVPIDKDKFMTLYQVVDIRTKNVDDQGKAHPLDPARMADALAWAKSMKDTPYSWWDIAAQGFNVIFPGNKMQLLQEDRYDCSNFACRILDKAGVPLPADFGYPYNVSPNDIAEWAGLLPGRKRILK